MQPQKKCATCGSTEGPLFSYYTSGISLEKRKEEYKVKPFYCASCFAKGIGESNF